MAIDMTKEGAAGRGPVAGRAHRTVYVRIVVDAAGVLRDRPDRNADARTPTKIGFVSGQFAATATGGTMDQDTGDIALDACAGDTVRFFAKSGSNNFEHAVLIEDMRGIGTDNILENFELLKLPRMGLIPTAEMAGQSAKVVQQVSWFWQCAVVGEGTHGCSLVLALHDRDEEGQPRFAGLYRWDLKLTVHCDPTNAQEEKTP
ncbi:MAG: AidA/PixA family protein [Rhizomicrobium sp.]